MGKKDADANAGAVLAELGAAPQGLTVKQLAERLQLTPAQAWAALQAASKAQPVYTQGGIWHVLQRTR